MKRKCLSVSDKLAIVDSLKAHSKTRAQLSTEYGIGLSSITKIVADEGKLRAEALHNRNMSAKKFRSSSHHDVNSALTNWFHQVRAANVPINGPLIMEKAKQLAVQLNVSFEPSNGWLMRWKQSNNITFQKVQGERASADTERAQSWTTDVLPGLCRNYTPSNRYNADESALFYKALPAGTMAVAGSKPTSTKVSKDRLTILFLTNQDGSDKQVFVIGKSKKLQCFNGVKSLPFPYYHNTKAWMTSVVWTEILKKWDATLRRKSDSLL